MVARVSPLRAKRKAEKDLQNYDELNTIKVPITALRFELAKWAKAGTTEIALGDLLLNLQTLVRENTS